jgi:hypothetical protein
VLSVYFSGFGFAAVKNRIGGVTFRNDDIFIEVSYDSEAYPNHTLSVVIGIGKEAYDENGKFTGIPIWSVIPENAIESDLLIRSFSDEAELNDLLFEIKTRVLEPYVKALWINRTKLAEEMKKFATE